VIFFDTETIGYHGPIVLYQWAEDDGPIHLHETWRTPIGETIQLYEDLANHEEGVAGFNLTFDWFHICQQYTTLLLLQDEVGPFELPEDHIETYAILEKKARSGPCIKPQTALDLMLHARKGPYQSTMNRGDIRIRRVPTRIAFDLAMELSERIPLSDIHFAKFKDKTRRWVVYDIKNDLGDVHPDLKDVVLKFNPSSGLKALAVDAGLADGDEEVLLFEDVNISKKFPVKELGYAPFAMAIGKPGGYGSWNGAWPQIIKEHIAHWAFNPKARRYAEDDVKYTRGLYHHFGAPDCGDDDSILACMVGAVRWSGFALDVKKLGGLLKETQEFLASIPYNFNSTKVAKTYLEQTLGETEKVIIQDSTKKVILEELVTWTLGEVCDTCSGLGVIMDTSKQDGEQPCTNEKCKDGEVPNPDRPHPVAKRARLILDFRRVQNERNLYTKLIQAGRFHVDVNVIGALSSRMSGAGGVNAQGINKQKAVRSCFPLADGSFILCGGDFAGFEVTLMDAAYGDPQLHQDLISRRPCIYCDSKRHNDCNGDGCDDCDNGVCQECDDDCTQETKIHALFGVNFFPGMDYADILATKGLDEEHDKYSRSKNGLFALAYGGEAYTLMTRVGVSEEAAMKGYEKFMETYPTFAKERAKLQASFSPVEQPGGLGSRPFWRGDPAAYVESMFGFRRFFTMENKVIEALWEICQNPPARWTDIKTKVVRREKEQKAINAARSALLGSIFSIQGANTRAAGNHKIQSAGATLTKSLQRKCWDLQPCGVNPFQIKTLNVHDEIMVPVIEELIEPLEILVEDFVEEHRERVPLLAIDWGSRLKSWAEK
jgi:hypothetical protein